VCVITKLIRNASIFLLLLFYLLYFVCPPGIKVVLVYCHRSASLKKFWVSYREPGQQSQEYHFSKGSEGQILQELGGNLVLEDHTPVSDDPLHVVLRLFACAVRNDR